MKTTRKFVNNAVVAAALGVAGMSGAQAATIACGDLSLGIRTTTVDPALSCLYAGLTNLGDPALVALVDSLITPDDSVLIDRDAANTNGDELSITGVGGQSGNWSFASSLWDDYDRLFLYLHFGDAADEPGTGSTTDPDIFIVELLSPTFAGTWSFGPSTAKLTGLSNIALLGVEGGGGGDDDVVPEPGVLFLMGAGLLGLGMARRRKSA